MSSYAAQFTDIEGEVRLTGDLEFLGPQPGANAVLYYTGGGSTGAPSGGGGGWVLGPAGVVQIDPVSQVYGQVDASATAPLSTYAAMATIFTYGGVIFTATDTSGDLYDASVSVIIQNETGSQSATLSGGASISSSPTGGTVTIASTDLTMSATTGTDITYDDATGVVATTAGGSFAVQILLSGGWD